jgi:murein DD-endopeptidase MepM/ murein hydrolase activator NlpD
MDSERIVAALLIAFGGTLAAQGVSSQPQLRAPWSGSHSITQGNHGSASHNACGQRTLDPNNCNWENTFAIDIDLNYESVLAAADGVVTYASDDITPLGGRQMAVTHTGSDGNQYTTVYMHLSKILVYGGAVTQGQPIATSGASSGGSESGTAPHLHFHMWSGSGSRDSHTMPSAVILLKRSGVDAAYRQYDERNGDLDDAVIRGAMFESNCDCNGGSSRGYRPNGATIAHPAGTLVKAASSGTVFVLRGPDGNLPSIYRSAIASLPAMRNPYNQPYAGDQLVQGNIITIDDDEMNQYQLSGVISSPKQLPANGLGVPDGLLVMSPNSGEISIISAGRRRPFTSSDIFLGLGFKFCNVVKDIYYGSYPVGDSLTSSAAQGAANNVVQNGGFESALSNWSVPNWGAMPAPWLTTNAHSGGSAACVGNSTNAFASSGASAIYQWVSIPATSGSVNLSFWYFPWTGVGSTLDGQQVLLFDSQGNYAATPMQILEGDSVWKTRSIDLSSYRGQSIALMFDVYRGAAGNQTGMCIDDVSIRESTSTIPANSAMANVQLTFTPNPVSFNGSDARWEYTVTLREVAGVGVNLTNMAVGGTDYSSSIANWFGSNQLTASGQLTASMWSQGYNPPFDLVWTISGIDANGHSITTSAAVHVQ